MEDYKIELGINLKDSDFKTLQTKIKSLEDDKIKIKLDDSTVDVQVASIKQQLENLGKTKGLKLDTTTLEKSLGEVSSTIKQIKSAIGTLDSKKGMTSLLTTINKISKSLTSVSKQFVNLNKSLSALSGKDLSLNFNLKMGNSNPVKAMTDYGQKARRETIPALQEQVAYLKNALGGTQEADKALERYLVKLHKGFGGVSAKKTIEDDMINADSLSGQMGAYEKYIGYLKQVASINDVDLSGFNAKFSKAAEDVIDDTTKIQSGVNETEEQFERLKNLFGSGIDAEGLSASLDPIIANLGEIRKAIQDLSKGISLDGLTTSFDRLSSSIENLLANAERVKGVLNSDLGNSAIGRTSTVDVSSIKTAKQTGQKIGETVTNSTKQALSIDNVIDEQVHSLMDTFGVKGKNAFNDIKQAIVEYRREIALADSADDSIDDSIDTLVNSSNGIDKITSAIANHIKEVNLLKETYEKLADAVKKTEGKIHIPKDVKDNFGEDFKNMRSSLGSAFTSSGKGLDFESWVVELNERTGNLIDLSNGASGAFEDLVKKVGYGRGSKYVSGDAIFKQGNYSREDMASKVIASLDAIEDSEQQLAQTSTQTTNTITQNENKKQQSYRESLLAKKQELEQYIQDASESVRQWQDKLSHPSPDDTPEDLQIYSDGIDAWEEEIKKKHAELKEIDAALNKIKSTSDLSSKFKEADIQIGATEDHIEHLSEALSKIGFNGNAIDSITKDFDELGISVKNVTTRLNNDGSINLAVKDTDQYERAVTAIRRAYTDDFGDIRVQNLGTTISQSLKESDAFIKRQKNAVADLSNTINQLNRASVDSNASRPIKNTAHLESLESQYKEVTSAIQRMENASDDNTFQEERNNVRRLISEYKSLTAEYKNAENTATSLRSKDINTAKATYASDLDVLISNMRKDGVYTSGFEKGAENLRSVLSNATDTSGLNAFSNELDKLEAGYKRVIAYAKEFGQADTYGKRASGLKSSIENIQRISPEINEFEAEINGAKVSVQSLLTALSQVKTKGDFDSVNEDLKAFKKSAEASGIAIRETVTKTNSVNKIKDKLKDTGFNGFEQEVRRAHIEAEKLEGSTIELEAALRKLDVAMAGVYSADQANDAKRLVNANEEYESSLKQVYSQLKLNQQAEKESFNAEMLQQKKASLNSDMEIWLKENTRAAKDFGEEIRRLRASLDGLDDNGVKLAGQQFKNLTKQAQVMGKTGLTVFDKLKSKVREYMAYLSAAELFMYAEQALRSMFEAVKEIDTAMTGLYRVTDLTAAEYDNLFNNMIDSAKEYGATLNDIINATTDWVRAGFDANTSLGLAEITTMYQHISDLDYDTAAENLITAYNGFKDELNSLYGGDEVAAVKYIADIFNELDNNFAVTSAGLGEAMTRSASALDLAGNSIQETAALVTGITEVTQDPEKAGSALKVLSLRLRGMKGQLEELGEETDENVENISKMQGQILNMTNGKVNIFDGAGNFKSTYEIMKGIAEVWDDLSSIDQADLLETIAGKHRANDVAALLSNWENVEAAVKSATDAEGSAARENAKYVDSIQGRLDKMTTSWQSFANTFMSSDFLKGAISGLTKFIEGLEKVIDTVGTFPTLMGTIAAGFSFKNTGFFSVLNKDIAGAQKQLALFGKSFTDIKRDFSSGQNIFTSLFSKSITKADVGYITEYFKQIKSGVGTGQAYANTLSHASVAGKKMAVNIRKGAVSMDSLKTATISGKAALFGLEVAATAANMALTMGLSFAIQLVVEGIMKLVNADKELAESVEEITSKFKEQSDELKKLKSDYDTTNESSMISKYSKLSKGVDNLGRNVSLTTEEYSEYQSIVNTIAEQIPSLVSGYDEQGNALLTCKGNVESLTEAYEKLIHAQNQEILTNTGNIEKDFSNTLDKADGDGWWSDGHGFWAGLLTTYSLSGAHAPSYLDYELKNDTVQGIQDLLNATSDKEKDKILKKLKSDRYSSEEIRDALKNANIDVGAFEDPIKVLEKTLKTDPQKVKNIIDNYYGQFAEAVDEQKTIAQAKLSEAFDISSAISGLNYGNIGEELQAIAYQTVNSLDLDFFTKLQEQGKTVEQWTTEMLNQLNSISKADNAKIETGFDLQTQFNGGEISYGEYVRGLEDVESVIDDLNLKSEAKEQLKISLGLDDDGVIDQYNALVKRLTDSKNYDFNISETEAKKLLDGLSSEELAIAVDVITDMSNNNYSETADEIRTAIERELTKQGLSLDLTIEKAKVDFEALSTAISESFSGSGLSEESISAVEGIFSGLKGYDSSKLFERTANGIHLNSEEYRKLNSEYKKTNVANINKEMDSLGDIYNQTREELYRLTYGTDEYNDKARDLSAIEQQIKDLEKLAAGYEGVASAFQEWQMVESAGSQRDMYESIIEGFENIDDEISRGWYDDGTIEFLELLSGKDLSTAGIEEVKKAYKGLNQEIENTGYTVRDFFTTDEDGNSTNTGVYNFLKAIDKLEKSKFGGQDVVKRDNKTNKIIGFDFQVVGGDEVIAETLGISEELVQIMVRAADDAGFVVSMDGTYQQLDVLKEKAQEASESLNRILEKNGKKGFNFNFNTSDVKDITKQLDEAQKILDTFRNTDGTINTKLEGADEALTVASTLQSMLDKLTRPAYMDIEVSQVEDEIQEPLRNLQELRRLLETEHQLKLTGADTSQLEKSKQEVYEYFEGLDSDVKIKLGLVDEKGNPLTGQSLKDKLNSGDIAIEATVDIQMKMDDKLGILVDKALLDAGIIDGKEFKKRVDIYLNADVDNEDAKNKTEQAVNEVANGKGNKSSSKDGKSSSEKIDKNVDVNIKADEIDTSDVKNKTKETVEKESEEKLAVETTVELETTIDEALDLIEKFEDKDITIDVKVKGLDDVKQLNKQIDLATNIEGDIDNLSKFVEGAKALSELDDNISTFVTAEVKGNVIDEFEYKINNLKVFSDSAKDLDDIGFINSEVTANVKGNVIDEFEYKINNLKVFSDSAKDLGDIGNVESNVKATINSGSDGDVIDEFEYKLNNLGEFAEHVKKLQGLGDVDISVKATINSGDNGDVIDEFEYKLDNLSEFANHVRDLQGLQSVDISVNAAVNTGEDGDVVDTFEYKLNNLSKFADYVKELQGLNNVDVSVNATVNTGNDGDAIDTFEYKLNNLEVFAQGAKALQGVGNVSSEITAKVNTGESGDAIDTFEYKLDNLNTFAEGAKALQGVGNVSSIVTAEINSGSDGDVIDEFEYKLNNLEKFAQYARDLSGIGNVDVSVSAKVNTGESGDVIDTFEYKLDNLDEFADYAKKLQGLENVDISIKANVNTGESGDVVDTFEYKLDNLEGFADYAKSLQGLENVDITITANAKGNVVGEKTEGKINNLEVFAKGAKGLSNIESKDITITANAKGNVVGKKTEGKINNLEVFAKGAKKVQSLESKDITITANAKGNVVGKKTESKINNLEVFAKGAKSLQGIGSKTVEVTANAYGNVVGKKTEGKINNLKVFGDSAKALNGVSSKTVEITANANGNVISGEGSSSRLSSLTEFKSLVSGMSNQTVTVSVNANVDSANINQAITLLTNVTNSGVFKDYSATVQVGAKISNLDDTVVKNYKAPPKNGKVSYSVDPASSVYTWTAPNKDGVVNYSASVEALTDAQKHKKGTITYDVKLSGFPVVNGTANANGSAFANGTSGKAFKQGDWGVKKTETALTGELGQELVVYGNRFWTVGDNGAEFTTIPKGAIVFNHKQTEEIFKNGRVTSGGGRGKVFANGTAYINGTAYSSGSGGDTEIVIGKNSVTGEVYTKSKESNDFKETIDLIEIAISRLERDIDNLDRTTNNVYKSWGERNKALSNEIGKVNDEIALQQQAYNEYMKAANGVGLPSSWISKIKKGQVDITTITDEGLVDKIKSYQDWYEKALECKDVIEELKETEAELYKQRFDNVSAQYDGILGVIEHEKNMLDEYIAQSEAQGWLVSAKYYDALASNERENITKLQQQKNTMLAELQKVMQSGKIVKGSEAWYEMVSAVDEVTLAITQSQTTLLEYQQTIQQLKWESFDLLQERISAVTEEADFLIELMSNDKLHDDNGRLTDEGSSTMGLHGQNYNTYMYQADKYAKEAERLKKELAKDPYDTELESRYREMISLQQEYILAAENEKEAIRDLVEEGINLELEALDEKIQKYEEALDSQKDLYDYQKRVEEQTKNIASLEKQMAAYQGDNSEEARAKIQELKVSLDEAKNDLAETEYEKLISDTEVLLDDLYLEYENILNTRLDNIDALISDVISQINTDASMISTTLSEKADTVGYVLSDSMSLIWDTNSTKINSVITTYGEKFSDAQTTTNNALSTINLNLQSMITQLNSIANTNVKSAETSSASNSKQANAKKSNSPTSVNNQNNNKRTITNDDLMGIAAAIWLFGSVDSGWMWNPDREKRLTEKLGASNAKKVQEYINKYGESGKLYDFYISKRENLEKYRYKNFKTGAKKIVSNNMAWTQENGQEFIVRPSDGAILTPLAKGDSVLTSAASNNIWDMANSPADFIKDNLKLDATSVPNNSSVNNSIIQNFENITFSMPNVCGYNDLLAEMQRDPKFEKLILSMTIDQIAGKSKLAKGKSIR